MSYRIAKIEYEDSGRVRYQVQKNLDTDPDNWASVFTSDDLDKAREVLVERQAKPKITIVE